MTNLGQEEEENNNFSFYFYFSFENLEWGGGGGGGVREPENKKNIIALVTKNFLALFYLPICNEIIKVFKNFLAFYIR